MKKLTTLLLAAIISVALVFGLVACGNQPRTEVEKAVFAAEDMTLAELEAAAEAEYKAAGVKFTAKGLSSGLGKVMDAMKEKYSWFDHEDYSSGKDAALYKELSTTLGNNSFAADLVMTQDGASLKAELLDTGYAYSYDPSDIENIAKEDKDPAAAVYFNKVFMYRYGGDTGVKKDNLKNVWQLTGKDGATLKGIKALSFQDPTTEAINRNFLIMLTSKENCDILSKAYKNYFGKDWTATDDKYENIGYQFIADFIANVTTWHTSDTTVGKGPLADNTNGTVFYIGVNKLKDYGKEATVNLAAKADKTLWKNEVSMAGYNNTVEGFAGFTYKMWLVIPKTAKLPYTACLLAHYMLTAEGYAKGWKDMGYYSVNSDAAINSSDQTLAKWKECCVVEDIDYINSVYEEMDSFIKYCKNK